MAAIRFRDSSTRGGMTSIRCSTSITRRFASLSTMRIASSTRWIIASGLRRLDAHLLDALPQPLHYLDKPVLLGEGAADLRLQFVETAVRYIGRVAAGARLLDQFRRLRLEGADRGMRLADTAVHIGERTPDAVLIELPCLGILHGAAAMVVEVRPNIRDHHFDILEDFIAAPNPCHLIAHQGTQFVDLLLEVVDRYGIAPPPLFIAVAGIHCLSRVHRAGVLSWVRLTCLH